MAVYTHITQGELEEFLDGYDLGKLKSFEGITRGVSNTNYHVFTDKDRYILTLFEERRVRERELPFFFSYSGHLSKKGIETPRALPDKAGQDIKKLHGRAACFLNFLDGADIPKSELTPDHCAQMGGLLAKMHKATEDFKETRENSIGIYQWRALAEKVCRYADDFEEDLAEMLTSELMYLEQNWPENLPKGVVHADAFPDNVFFRQGKISAVIDFYFSCSEFYAYDFAISANAWCFDEAFRFVPERYENFRRAYEELRPFAAEERKAMRVLNRGSVFRILITRLEEYFEHDPQKTLMVPHDPAEYLAKLKFHQQNDVHD
jgi:homoserine kinase type II